MMGVTGEEPAEGTTRMDRRTDAWSDFLRRLLLTATLAGATALPAAPSDDAPPVEVAEAEQPVVTPRT
jgi:hypothetical protein